MRPVPFVQLPHVVSRTAYAELVRGLYLLFYTAEVSPNATPVKRDPHFVYILSAQRGQARITTAAGETLLVRKGDILIIPAETPPSELKTETSRLSWLALAISSRELPSEFVRMMSAYHIDTSVLLERLNSAGMVLIERADEVSSIFTDMYMLLKSKHVGHLRVKMIELFAEIVAALIPEAKLSAPTRKTKRRSQLSHTRLALLAQRIMMQDVSEPKTIEMLASMCQSSPTVLKEAFRETFGLPIYTWYKQYRMMLACEELKRGKQSIAELSAMMGYANPSKFSAAFSQVVGMSPRAYRKQFESKKGMGTT